MYENLLFNKLNQLLELSTALDKIVICVLRPETEDYAFEVG